MHLHRSSLDLQKAVRPELPQHKPLTVRPPEPAAGPSAQERPQREQQQYHCVICQSVEAWVHPQDMPQWLSEAGEHNMLIYAHAGVGATPGRCLSDHLKLVSTGDTQPEKNL